MASSLPPIFLHAFRTPLPYARALALQERLHALQLARRRTQQHHDLLLLLEHRPVYTAGRRQTASSPEMLEEEARLTRLGADFVHAKRGGQTTYHGPGQIVGYPLLDLSRSAPPMGIHEYICRMQRAIKAHLREAHDIASAPSDNTGVFLDATSKIASIGVQVRHRLTSHGFALNVTREPLVWFDKIVACGLPDVKATCIADASKKVPADKIVMLDEMTGLAQRLGHAFEREVVPLDLHADAEVGQAIREIELEAEEAGEWAKYPILESLDDTDNPSRKTGAR